jgi:hypothetical protein
VDLVADKRWHENTLLKMKTYTGHWWLLLIILATWEAEIGRIKV